MTQINIQIDTPVLRLDKFCERTGIPYRTAQAMIASGKLPILPKEKNAEKPLINMVAYSAVCANNARLTPRNAA